MAVLSASYGEGAQMKRKIAIICISWICFIFAPLGHAGTPVKEGQFAVKLAERLGLAKEADQAKAITLLNSAGITPRNGWHADSPANEELIIRTQVPIYLLLYKVSSSLKIPAPPTLSLQVLQSPYGPQTIMFSEGGASEGANTEGAFAVKLVRKLGLAKNPSEKEAIRLLSRIGIEPDGKWKPKAKATDLFVVRIQQSFLGILKDLAIKLTIPLPPTLNIRVEIVE